MEGFKDTAGGGPGGEGGGCEGGQEQAQPAGDIPIMFLVRKFIYYS